MVNAKHFEVLFRENYKRICEQSRIIWWKGNELGYNDNIYNCDDIVHDLYFSLRNSVMNEKIREFQNKEHFLAICYIRMKSIYWNYLKSKWNRSKREKIFFRELGYTYESVDILNSIFDYEVDEYSVNNFTTEDILQCINEIKNEEQRRILFLKQQDADHEKICFHFNYTKQELRNKLYNSRKKLFKILVSKNIINSEVNFKKFVGETTKKGRISRIVKDKKHLYTNYPFESNYKDKIEFVIKMNKGKIDLNLLPEIIKYNEGYQLKQDNRSSINYALEQCIRDYSCFILDGIVYLKHN